MRSILDYLWYVVLPSLAITALIVGFLMGLLWLLPEDATEVHGGNIYCRTVKPSMSWSGLERCFTK